MALVRLAVVEIVDAGEYRTQQQIRQGLQRMHQHRIVRGLADGQVESVVQVRMGGAVGLAAVRGKHFVIAAADHDEVGVRAADRRQPGRFAFEQRAHLQQVVQRARLRIEQVHQRARIHLRDLRHVRTLALGGMDDLARPQHPEPFAQRRARYTQLFGQPALGRQGLPGFEHAIEDQPLDTLGHHFGDLFARPVDAWFHDLPHWYDHDIRCYLLHTNGHSM